MKGTSTYSYSGTLKNSVCSLCLKILNNLSALEQEKHLENCKKQTRLV